jgi:hypothetical protein
MQALDWECEEEAEENDDDATAISARICGSK